MGLFDSVFFDCPGCGAHIEEQSKAGECYLARYWSSEVPAVIAADIDGEIAKCHKCKSYYKIVSNLPTQVHMYFESYQGEK